MTGSELELMRGAGRNIRNLSAHASGLSQELLRRVEATDEEDEEALRCLGTYAQFMEMHVLCRDLAQHMLSMFRQVLERLDRLETCHKSCLDQLFILEQGLEELQQYVGSGESVQAKKGSDRPPGINGRRLDPD